MNKHQRIVCFNAFFITIGSLSPLDLVVGATKVNPFLDKMEKSLALFSASAVHWEKKRNRMLMVIQIVTRRKSWLTARMKKIVMVTITRHEWTI